MLSFTRKLGPGTDARGSLTLTLDQRVKSRLRVVLDDGAEAGLFLQRGGILRHGDRIATEDGYVVEVRAAPEPVSTIRCGDPQLIARACYHLGNRHVPLQIEPGWLRYQHDQVLDEMLRGLGLEPELEQAPFEPEPGAYGGHGHGGGGNHHH